MFRVSYDYLEKRGFLETDVIDFTELRMAFAFINTLRHRKDVVGKPILERV